MAQTPTVAPPRSLPKLLARGVSRDMMPASAEIGDPAAPILLEFESPTATLLGRPIPARSRYVVWTIFAMFAAALTVAWTLPIDRVVTGSGKVVATAQNIVVQPLETSIVRSIDVQEGQFVHKGDLLARLDPTFAGSNSTNLVAQAAALTAETTRLQNELDGRNYISDGTPASQLQEMLFTQRHAELSQRTENYRQKIDSLQAKVDQAQSDIRGYTERLATAKTVEDKRRELERLQVGSQLNTLAAQDSRVEINRSLDAAKSILAGALRDLDAMKSERDAYVTQFRADTSQQLHDEGIKLDQARGDSEKAKLRKKLVELRADQDAIVLSLAPISVGSVMQSGDQFITLVPADSPLEIDTIIDGRDAGFVRIGDSTTIKFETFPYYTHGTARGVVRVMSPDSFHDPNADNSPDNMNSKVATKTRTEQAMGTLFYRARITIDELRLHDLPPGFRITPGMPVTADVKIGVRTVIQYLMSRVIPATTTGMREP